MKAPVQTLDYYDRSCIKECSTGENNGPENPLTTTTLLKFIGDITIKRRQIRKKTRCGNLLAEALLSNALREAKKELAKKQEEKRKNLQNFTYNVTISCTSVVSSCESDDNGSRVMLMDTDTFNSKDSIVQNCLSSLDSFFNELKEIKT